MPYDLQNTIYMLKHSAKSNHSAGKQYSSTGPLGPSGLSGEEPSGSLARLCAVNTLHQE